MAARNPDGGRSGGVTVAHQGEPGAFSEEAVVRYWGESAVPVPVRTWRAVFESIAAGDVDAGVAAIENSLAGTIRETYDLLLEFFDAGVRITGEVAVPVRLALVAPPGATLESIERVYSHPQALAQADEFLRTRPWSVMTTYNTAGAARMVAEGREQRAAAVASPRVAGMYGLEVLASDIQTGGDNRTRFAILGRGAAATRPGTGPMRTTLVFAVRNVPGSLHRCLGAFATRGLNLSRLESRPSRTARWEYVFWVDLDADGNEETAAEALDALRRDCEMVRVLGVYPADADS